MRLICEAFAPGTPKTKGSLDFRPDGTARENVAGSKRWRRLVADAVARSTVERGVTAPVCVQAVFWLPVPPSQIGKLWAAVWSRAGDIDKLSRNVLDACGSTDLKDAHIYADDNQVVTIWATKLPTTESIGPGALIRIWEVDPDWYIETANQRAAERWELQGRGGL